MHKQLKYSVFQKTLAMGVIIIFLLFVHISFTLAGPIDNFIFLTRSNETLHSISQIQSTDWIKEPFDTSFTVASTSFFVLHVPPRYKKQVVVNRFLVPITAYSSTYDQTDSSPFITASGTRVRDGIVATNFLPIGTKIKIPQYYGDKIFTVEDRMNRRYWNHIDIWMSDRGQAIQFGLRRAQIEVVREI